MRRFVPPDEAAAGRVPPRPGGGGVPRGHPAPGGGGGGGVGRSAGRAPGGGGPAPSRRRRAPPGRAAGRALRGGGPQQQHKEARSKAAIGLLSEEQREAFLMREFLNMQFKEIAEATGVPENTVKSRMRYALEKPRDLPEDHRELARAAP